MSMHFAVILDLVITQKCILSSPNNAPSVLFLLIQSFPSIQKESLKIFQALALLLSVTQRMHRRQPHFGGVGDLDEWQAVYQWTVLRFPVLDQTLIAKRHLPKEFILVEINRIHGLIRVPL
jgi:hypothetical protein